MGWIAAQFRTRPRWGWTLAGVLLSVLALHLWLLRHTWDGGWALPEPEPVNLVQGHLVMQRLAQTVTMPVPSTSVAAAAHPPIPVTSTQAPITPEPTIDTPLRTDETPQKAPPEAPSPPEAEPARDIPSLRTEHLHDISTLWRYRVTAESKGRTFFAHATLQWSVTDERYSAHANVSTLLLGQRTQTSVGRLTTQGLAPERFTDVSKRTREMTLDWNQHTAQRDGQTLAHDLPEGTQDRLSAIIQLTVQLMNTPTQPVSQQTWTLPVMGFSGLERWAFVYQGQALQELPAGQFITWHLQRKPTANDKRGVTVDLWLAPAQYFAPVRIRYTEANGDFIDQQLSAL